MKNASLGARERLRLSSRFDAIRRQGRWARGRFLTIGILPNGLTVTRVGLRVQRGVKKAVVRNRSKRMFRTAYRMNKHQFKNGFDIVVVISRLYTGGDAAALEHDLMKLGNSLKLLR